MSKTDQEAKMNNTETSSYWKYVRTTVTHRQLVEATGGIDPNNSQDPVYVKCPASYDEQAITADDIVNDGQVAVLDANDPHLDYLFR